MADLAQAELASRKIQDGVHYVNITEYVYIIKQGDLVSVIDINT